MFKNKNIQLGIAVGLILAVLVGGYFLIAGKTKKVPPPVATEDTTVYELSAKELGLDFEVSPDRKKVRFIIGKIADIKSVEYQLTYEADSTVQEQQEGGEDRVERGITGEADIDIEESDYTSPWLDLGSCSANVCRYDTGVDSIKLTLKIVKTNKKIYHTEKTFEL